MKRIMLMVTIGCTAALAGCATHVNVASTHREDVGTQARVLAIAARNLEDSLPRNRPEVAEQEAAEAVVKFHAETETYARAAARWMSDDNVNTRFEKMIEAWVLVKHTFPALKADPLLQKSYERVQHEWEKLGRATGYAGRKYENEVEKRYNQPPPESK